VRFDKSAYPYCPKSAAFCSSFSAFTGADKTGHASGCRWKSHNQAEEDVLGAFMPQSTDI